MVISGKLSSFLKGVNPILLYDVDRGMVMEPMHDPHHTEQVA